ncbi:MAG: hypothetical protein ACP6IY_07730 [Promethearchaeia archaeon]
MTITIQEEDSLKTLTQRAESLLNEIKTLQFVKSANILIGVFGMERGFKRIKKKRLGQQIEMHFPALGTSITFTLVQKMEDFKCVFGKPNNPVAKIILNVKKDKILETASWIIRQKDNIFSLIKILPKVLIGKIKIKGSLIAAILLCRCLMIGKHDVYKGQL